MKKLLILLLCVPFFVGRMNAAAILHNDYSYLQEVTLELYTDDVPAYKVPEQMKSIEEVLMFDVMHATWKDNKWVAYTLNKDLLGTYKVGQPALLDNGKSKKIFFISNFPGSVGGLDIYSAEYTNGKWSKPKNLGDVVNTINNETNPGLLNENTLTYSSKGIIKKLDLKTLKVVDLVDNTSAKISTSTQPSSKDDLAAIGDNSTATPSGTTPSEDYGAIGDNSSAMPIKTSKAAESMKMEEKATYSTPKQPSVSTNTTSKVDNLGVQTRDAMLAKYKTAIQLGAFSTPKWEQIMPLSEFGKIISYKNENGVNVVWLVGFANRTAAENVLPKIKAIPGFENAYVTGK